MHERFTRSRSASATRSNRRAGSGRPAALPLVVATVVFALVGGPARLARRPTAGARCTRARATSSSSRSAPALIANAALCLGAVFNRPRSGAGARRRGQDGGRALGGVPPLPHRLPAPAGSAARDARALGALPRLRHRVRDRRARAAGRAPAHAGGAARGELDLLDLSPTATSARARRPRRSATSRPASAPRSRRRLGLAAAWRRLLGRRRRRRRRGGGGEASASRGRRESS